VAVKDDTTSCEETKEGNAGGQLINEEDVDFRIDGRGCVLNGSVELSFGLLCPVHR
jgi:hypothetical protein